MSRRGMLIAATVAAAAIVSIGVFVALGAPGGGGGDEPPEDLFFRPTPTPLVWSTVAAPEATAVGRDDCPAGWAVYVDPQDRYSICFPAEFEVSATGDDLNANKPRPRGDETDNLAIIVSWTPQSEFGPSGLTADVCGKSHVSRQVSGAVDELTVDGEAVQTCFNVGEAEGDPPLPLGDVRGEIPLAADGSDREGFVRFRAGFTASEVTEITEISRQILGTLRVNRR